MKHLNHSLVTRTSLSAALTCQQVITHIQKDMNMQRPPPLMLDEIRITAIGERRLSLKPELML
ncbi:hypothetical protein [Pseudomonas sp. HMWF006]|uniref:hypothetical protein n=1 Tax=Pseudomonas sp. HMWF006 TaxID=2056843 RepID=UPI000FFC6CCB|nr:hypothetical protein [Pseudomonas sp. HMWF006]